ncbi:MAG: hypothetical protein DRJ09_02220 [Bacteroidetes bacterium]|nr:MAG: hypothetical protein DRJ09_02220 [Bacteroidota bacterium]
MKFVHALVMVPLLLFSTIVRGGWVISEVSSDQFGNKSHQTTFLQNNKVRYESELSIAIIDLDKALITLVFPVQKVYWQGTANELRKGTRKAFEAQIRSLIDEASADQKDTYQQYYDDILTKIETGDSIPVKTDVTIKDLHVVDTIDSYVVHGYNVYVDSVINEKIWISFDKIPFKEIDLHKLMRFTTQMAPMNNGVNVSNSDQYINLVQKGLVVKTKKYIDRHQATTTKLTLAKEGKISDSFFTAPPMYRKASISEILEMSAENDLPDINAKPDNNSSSPFKDSKGF